MSDQINHPAAMTGAELRAARAALGLTGRQLADLLQIASDRTIRRYEAGDSEVPGPVVVILRALVESAAVREYFGYETLGALSYEQHTGPGGGNQG